MLAWKASLFHKERFSVFTISSPNTFKPRIYFEALSELYFHDLYKLR